MSHTPAASQTAQDAGVPASPFATAAEQVEVLALADAICDLAHHHLESVGGKGKGRAMSDRDMRSESCTFAPLAHAALTAQPLKGSWEVGAARMQGAHCVKLKL